MKTILHILSTLVMTLILSSCINENEEPASSLSVGDRCPQFSIVMNDGTTISTSDLSGHKSIIVFFNTGCPDCQREFPEVQKVYDYLQAEKSPIPLISISREESAESIEQFWTLNHLTIPYSAQPDRKIYSLFATSIIPRIYILNPDLTIKAVFTDNPIPTAAEILDTLK